MTNHKPRILILIKGLGLGGAERLLVGALPHLSRDEFDYHVGYFLPWKDALAADFAAAGIPVTCFDCRTPYSLGAVRKVRRFLREQNVALLHSHLPSASIAGRIAARIRNPPKTVYTEHGCWNRLHPITRTINRRTLPWNDLNIAVSDEVRDSMEGARVLVIPNGIDCQGLASTPNERDAVCAELDVPSDDFLVIKVANLSPVKNHEMLIRAFAALQQSVPNSTLILVGQLRDRDEPLRQLAGSLGVEPRIRITGPRTDVPLLVRAADVFAMSSKSEGLPVSLLEAMALEKPVVCPRVGGIPGVVRDGESGLLVAPGADQELAEALRKVAEDREFARKLGQAAGQEVRQRYDVKVMVQQVESEYRRLLAGETQLRTADEQVATR